MGGEEKYTYDDLSEFKVVCNNNKVATIDVKGNITAKSTGTATITVTAKNG